MVKYASSLFVAALVAAPALAQTTWEEFDTREYDDLFARHPDEAGLTARELYEQAPTSIFARAGDFDETFSRRSYGRTADLDAREVDALYKHAVSQLDQPMFSFFYFMRDAMKRVKALAHAPPPPVKGSKDLDTTGTSKDAEKPCDEKKKEKGDEKEKEKEKQQTDSRPSEGKPPAGETKPEGAADGAADGGATGAPEARGLSDEDLWERELENILQERNYVDEDSLYARSYYDDEDGIYSRSYDDAYDLYARSDNTYDPLFAREDSYDLD